MATNPILNVARKGALAYVGALALTGDQVASTFDRMARRGAQVEQATRKRIERTFRSARTGVADGREQATEARENLARSRDRLLNALNIPSQASIAGLNDQVARLSVQIDELRGTLRRRAAQVPGEPLPGYDKLNAESVVERLPKLEEPALLALRAYEQQHTNRVTVLRPVERTLVERQAARGGLAAPAFRTTVEPLPRYEELRAEEIVDRIPQLSPAELLHVRTYEQQHQARVTVLRALDERLAPKVEA